MPSKRTGSILCETCGKPCENCACPGTGHNILAFHDNIGGTIKVYERMDTIFLDCESERRTQSVMLSSSDLTHIAQMWLAYLEADEDDHVHHFTSALDPRYEFCLCGEIRETRLQNSEAIYQ